ncbi:uncharacterized protein CC84DRAFT_94965 [Paraphaeosphaeria sporulosa]|uniref:Zn(2)-C6 fungal-type domain-containing protein n=1 Tax=Paraphaeosphaeria sporulosa TaxID=1460663 RepID=A0A177CYW7_9PLEO|nr:uncharacterized protein CC84DRAFT_94965 [Paraphaeosphaeria sporulosa]OAG12268.1 hypothetical protein CC84DRAFT_94965 [Paraphaeosphaeria sporulosa]
MVGVPGRSKGCSTCRYRKKGCDQLRPICGNCIRGGLECGGYERTIILVHADDSGKGTYKPVVKKAQNRSQQPGPMCGPVFVAPQSKGLNRTSFELRFYENFWDLFLPPRSGPVDPCTTSFVSSGTQWADYTLNCVPRSEVTRCALLALSTSKIGRDTEDKLLTRQGLELYGKALSLFAKELQTPGKAKPFEVLNCCRILALYEQLNDISAAARNWKGHIQGLLSLVHQHPPEAFSHTGAHEIFLECRHNGVTSALANRKATFLSKPEWISGPWKSRHKDVVDTAFDILVKIPGVLEEWDLISTRTSTGEALRRARVFRDQCSKVDHELSMWYSSFISVLAHAHPVEAEALLNGTDRPAQQTMIPDILAKVGLHHLHAMMIYWTTCMILHATIDLVDDFFPMATSFGSEAPRLRGFQIIKYLICLAHSAKYFLGSEMGLLGPLIISYTGTGLIRTLYAHQACFPEADPKDLEELRHVMKSIGSLRGFNTWQMWKHGMDELNNDKKAIIDRYNHDHVDCKNGHLT